MKKIFNYSCIIGICAILFTSCKKDAYIAGGETHQPGKADMPTFDYLKGNSRGLFDTLMLIMDAAGLKDLVNKPNVTFFSPTDYSINEYLGYRTKQEQVIDPKRVWSLDSLLRYDLPKFADSMKVYFVSTPLSFEMLTNNGAVYSTLHEEDKCVVSYEYATPDDPWYNPNLSEQPRTVHYTYLYQDPPLPVVAQEIGSETGARTLVQTSGIQTNTGRLNVLTNDHTLFFRKK